MKPTHSGTCLPYDAHVPSSRKKCLVIAETIRARRIASQGFQEGSQSKVTQRFLQNGYPHHMIKNIVRNISTTQKEPAEFATYLKVPYRGEQHRRRVLRLRQAAGLSDMVRIIFTTERPLAWQFRPKHEFVPCPPQCIACHTAERPGYCFTKMAVYQITCQVCQAIYIGQTDRTIRSRVEEHSKVHSSHVYLHMLTHGDGNCTKFKWRILRTHPHLTTRLAVEALYIRQAQERLMNGCEGAQLLPFLR